MASASVFVRNLPYGVTQENLEQVFGEVGPVKKVDVIKNKGARKNEQNTRGFAFVKFAVPTDAQLAIERLNGMDLDGRKMRIEIAKEKPQKRGGKVITPNVVEESSEVKPEIKEEPVDVQEPVPTVAPVTEEEPKIKTEGKQSDRNARRRQHREFLRQVEERKEAQATPSSKSIVLSGLAPDVEKKQVFKKVKKIAPVDSVEVKELSNGVKYAVVQLQALRDVEKAVEKLDNHIFKGQKLSVEAYHQFSAGKRQREAVGQRLIVRNLHFETKDEDLQKVFSKFGQVEEAKVVRHAAEEGALGKSRGFGFVQFLDPSVVASAVQELNGSKLKGREMVVDVAVKKSEYVKRQETAEEETVKEEEESIKEEEESIKEEEDSIKEDDSVKEEEDEEMESVEEEEVEDEEMEDEEMEEEEEEKSAPKKDSEAERLRTVFVRNLSFQTTEDAVRSFFSTFGPVQYARIVMDKGSGLSRGVAFVRFQDQDAADRVLSKSRVQEEQDKKDKKDKFQLSALADGDALTLDGRMLTVTPTLSKDEASKVSEENRLARQRKDKRNLHLAYEGTINVNKMTEEELAGMPKIDQERRKRAVKEKKEKLKDPLNFVSPYRLSVRNLALSVDEKQLKEVFKEAAEKGLDKSEKKVNYDLRLSRPDAPVKVKLAKVVRETEDVKPGKTAKSKGYGFVEFTEHPHALAALRTLNNNTAYTKYAVGGSSVKKGKGGKQEKTRLIVEFALENHGKLKLREKRQQDAAKKRQEARALEKAQGVEKKKKQSRGQRQREKKRQRAAEQAEGGDENEEGTPEAKKAKVEEPVEPVQPIEPVEAEEASEPKKKKGKRKRGKQGPEDSFEAMVRNYKTELFGDQEKKAAQRWFD